MNRATELFGNRIRELRRRQKLTQEVVAKRIACSQSHLSTIEWGDRVPNLLMMIRLARALECRVSDLTRVFDREDLAEILPDRHARGQVRRKRGTNA